MWIASLSSSSQFRVGSSVVLRSWADLTIAFLENLLLAAELFCYAFDGVMGGEDCSFLPGDEV
jgi:hypothetical protein